MKANYEFQLPKVFSYTYPITLAFLILAGLLPVTLSKFPVLSYALASFLLMFVVAYVGTYFFVRNFTNTERRLGDRDLLLRQIPWQGDESVLDVGCGNGILILSAAKNLTTGHAVGIDIWTDNSGDNTEEIFQHNARIEGVEGRVELQREDARDLPYKDASFDVVLCGLTMHHILHDSGADIAVQEMLRVLKPNGLIAIYDVPIAIYSVGKLLKKSVLETNKINNRIIIGKKP